MMEMHILPEDQPPGLGVLNKIRQSVGLQSRSPMNSYRFSFRDLTPDAETKFADLRCSIRPLSTAWRSSMRLSLHFSFSDFSRSGQ
jgi:hypothetical protein